MIETDVLYAYVKERDWLTPVAEKLINLIERRSFRQSVFLETA